MVQKSCFFDCLTDIKTPWNLTQPHARQRLESVQVYFGAGLQNTVTVTSSYAVFISSIS